jgi:ubiquinone/menaquinone biosynthesis C-methylase UbiE
MAGAGGSLIVDPRLQRRVQRYGWDRAAIHYEGRWSRQLGPAQELLLRMADPAPGEEVLDVACGTGLVTLPAARRVGPRGRVVGTDISQGMIDEGLRLAQLAGAGNIHFELMDAEELELPEDAFDLALCALGLMYVPDPVAALAQMHRVLRPGGRGVAAVWGPRSACGWAEVFPIVDARVNSEVCPLFFQLGTGDTLAAGFRRAGFVEVTAERLSVPLPYDSDDDAVGAAFDGGPVAMAWSRFDDETRADCRREYRESIAGFRKGRGYEIPGEFVVVRGVKS